MDRRYGKRCVQMFMHPVALNSVKPFAVERVVVVFDSNVSEEKPV